MIGPHTEIQGLITPGDWVDFFRYVSEPYEGILVPETDNRDLKSILIPKVMAAKGKFDVVFQPNYVPPEVSDWTKEDEKLPQSNEGYFLRANTGPRWMLGGVMSRPFVTTKQSDGVCAISSIESSKDYGETIFSKYMTFKSVDHCLCVMEGTLKVSLEGSGETLFREGETVVIPAGQAFSLGFESKYVKVHSFSDGDGIESLIHQLGKSIEQFVLPEQAAEWDASQLATAAENLNITLS
jgi:mannose-6-phosphate isomerase-like protein (cupin superfamily)